MLNWTTGIAWRGFAGLLVCIGMGGIALAQAPNTGPTPPAPPGTTLVAPLREPLLRSHRLSSIEVAQRSLWFTGLR
jgi:hypothetical protein